MDILIYQKNDEIFLDDQTLDEMPEELINSIPDHSNEEPDEV
jgi:hypothetical protein